MFGVRRSIGRKLILVVLAALIVALLTSAAALLWYDARTFRQSWIADLAAQADFLARATAPALAFNDPEAVRGDLELFAVRPSVAAAAVYARDGRLFAAYSRADAIRPPEQVTIGVVEPVVSGEHIFVQQPIVEGSQVLGAVYVHGRYGPTERLGAYARILALVMLGSLLLAAAATLWLQNSVTRPIEQLTATAREIIERRDFSLRARKTTRDEVGVLVDAFNAMLGEVERNASALREADRLKDEFLATLAHELRNPLAPLSNGLELLPSASRDQSRLSAVRDMMQRQLRQLVRLVDDLLDVSRIRTGRLIIKRELIDLRAVVASAVEIARPVIDLHQHRLSMDVADQSLMVNGDATRLAQVISNLLNNAAKYTPPGGSVALTAHAAGEEIFVTVRDSGIGLDRDNLETVFGMFVQVDRSLERTTAGLGVGLSLAKQLVELHGGSISAHSDGPGRGSTFTVRLPRAAGVLTQRIEPTPSSVQTGAKRRVLIADDNVDFVAGLEAILHQQGHEVVVAHDGEAAWATAQRFKPEFAFLDIGLPKVNGYELARRMRSADATSRCVLTAVTGWGQPEDRDRARGAGFDFHCVKPVELEEITRILGGGVRAAAPLSESLT